MSRTLSICCSRAVIIRTLGGDCPEYNWHECAKCGQPCDVYNFFESAEIKQEVIE